MFSFLVSRFPACESRYLFLIGHHIPCMLHSHMFPLEKGFLSISQGIVALQTEKLTILEAANPSIDIS